MTHLLYGGNSAAKYCAGILNYLTSGDTSIVGGPLLATSVSGGVSNGFVKQTGDSPEREIGNAGVCAIALRDDDLPLQQEGGVGESGMFSHLMVNSVGSIYSTLTYEITLNKAVVTASDASTNALVAATGQTYERIALVDIIISTSGAQKFTISDASTSILGPIFLAANSTTSINLNRPMIITANQALNYTNSVASEHSVSVTYFIANGRNNPV